MNNIPINQIEEEILKAFSEIEYPGDTKIAYIDSIHVEDFIGKNRADLTHTQIMRQQHDLLDFSPEAFCYYLPTFMIVVIKNPLEWDMLADNLIHYLSPPIKSVPILLQWFERVSSILNDNQAQLIIKFCLTYQDLMISHQGYLPEKEANKVEKCVSYWRTVI